MEQLEIEGRTCVLNDILRIHDLFQKLQLNFDFTSHDWNIIILLLNMIVFDLFKSDKETTETIVKTTCLSRIKI